MSGVAMSACGALGVNYVASAPRCELYKLLLYETGSQYVHQEDYKVLDNKNTHLVCHVIVFCLMLSEYFPIA